MDGGGTPEPPPAAVAGDGTSGSPVAGRWNPTKDQITMLESLYEQGLRTPTAEQIQAITTRLQAYGHIEGKNVFYWFQNHKARQRQKEKQDHQFSLFRQYHHHHHQFRRPPPPFLSLPPSPNVIFEPCYMSQNNLGFYGHYPQVISPSTGRRRSPRSAKPRSPNSGGILSTHQPESVVTVAGGHKLMVEEHERIVNGRSYGDNKETLDLFPLHPTGILQERENTSTISNASCTVASTACTLSSSGGVVDRHYFDFFA